MSGRALRSAAKTYWMRVVDTSSEAKSAATTRESRRTGAFTDSLTTSVRASATGLGALASGSGRRAWSEIRSRMATRVQFASSEEPPDDRNGIVRPVSGMTRVTPPTTTKHCSATEKDRPAASSLPKPSRVPSEVRRPRSTSSA